MLGMTLASEQDLCACACIRMMVLVEGVMAWRNVGICLGNCHSCTLLKRHAFNDLAVQRQKELPTIRK